jgi:hypothetical protein
MKWPKTASPDGASKPELFSRRLNRRVRSGSGYQVAPDGTILSLSIQRLTDDNIEEAI